MTNKKLIPYPSTENLSAYQKSYIGLVPGHMDLLTALDHSFSAVSKTLEGIDETRSLYAYAAGKWSIKTMLMHINDTELIFLYRALSIARGSKHEHPGYEENEYADSSLADQVLWSDIYAEFKAVSSGVFLFFKNIPGNEYLHQGIANGLSVTPQQIGFMLAGHRLHHLQVLKERYVV